MKPHRIRMTHNLISNYGLCDENEYDAPDGVGEGARALNDWAADKDPEIQEAAKWEKRVMNGPRGKAMQVFVSTNGVRTARMRLTTSARAVPRKRK